ncbi:MAG TPA: hypothetical protein VMJ10_02595 [Kofleriaceae bacterium]|nr:hypothetical protein [Kofleriaceae bacterium]
MIRAAVAYIGAAFIYALIWIFGRTRRRADVPWLAGPTGERTIGDAPYRDVAEREGLTLERSASDGGLIPDFHQLDGPSFDAARAHPLVREFYEHTTRFAMDVWSRTFFPANIGMWLLVTTISRQVDQLNFPLSPLDTAHGMASEIILLRRPDGKVRYTGWFRTLSEPTRVLYTGFYMTASVPAEPGPCVKVVFPMPRGNATVILRAALEPDGSLVLDSRGGRFGGAGFYRQQLRDDDRVRVWKVRTLRERFHIYVDEAGTVRCDHDVRFLGLPVLRLHYKMFRREHAHA